MSSCKLNKPIHRVRKVFAIILINFFVFSCLAEPVHFVTEDLPPFQLVAKGNVTGGAMVELIQELIKETDLNASIDGYPWSRAYKLALQKPNTLIFSMRRTRAREKHFHWLGHLYTIKTQVSALASRGDIKVTTSEDLNLYRIGVVRGDYDQYLLQDLGISDNVYLGLSYRELWQMLKKGRLDCIMTNPITAKLALQDLDIAPSEISVVYEFVEAENQFFLAANLASDPALLEKLTSGLVTLRSDGVYDEIMKKWSL